MSNSYWCWGGLEIGYRSASDAIPIASMPKAKSRKFEGFRVSSVSILLKRRLYSKGVGNPEIGMATRGTTPGAAKHVSRAAPR
jgi:hypothetical protein